MNGRSTPAMQCARFSRIALVVGLASAAILGAASWLSPAVAVPRILPGYLTAFLYFLGLSLGSCVLLMIHGLTGGRWGMFIGRSLSAAVAPLPLLALLFLPIAFGVEQLYPWATPEMAAHHRIVAAKSQYLNIEGFELRAGIAFGLWLLIGLCLRRWTQPADRDRIAVARRRLGKLSGPGLICYGLTMTFASVDWNMSLMPEWYSSMLPVIGWGSQVLSAMALATLVTTLVREDGPWAKVASAERYSDLGGLLFTFTMFWAYTSFMQFLIIWSGNLPHEITYFLVRTAGSWFYVFLSIVVLAWALPYFSLLLRPIKTNPKRLALVAGLLVVMRLVDIYWWIMPSIYPEWVVFSWQELLSVLAIGGLWSCVYANRFAQVLTGPIEEFGVKEWTTSLQTQDGHG
jgi:hypothetical protein